MSNNSRNAVVTIANDRFLDYFIPFLESFRERNPMLRLIVIPFDDNSKQVSALSGIYGFETYQGSFSRIDELSEFLFGEKPYLKNRLRKLIAFDLDLDEFLYIDSDILVQQSVGSFFGKIRPGTIDLVYVSNAGSVYKAHPPAAMPFKQECFTTGIFASSARVARVDEICSVIGKRRDQFLQMRVEHLYDQPLINFFIHVTGKAVCRARELSIPVVYSGVFGRADLRPSGEGRLMNSAGHAVTLIHWAGPRKFRKTVPLSDLLDPYVLRAQSKFVSVPDLAEWRPLYARVGEK